MKSSFPKDKIDVFTENEVTKTIQRMRTKLKTPVRFNYCGSHSQEILVMILELNPQILNSKKFQVDSEAQLKAVSHHILSRFSKRSYLPRQLEGEIPQSVRRFVEG